MKSVLRIGLAFTILAMLLSPTWAQQGSTRVTRLQKRLISGAVPLTLDARTTPKLNLTGLTIVSPPPPCAGTSIGSNIRVNQNCLDVSDLDLGGPAQVNNEGAVAQDPNNLGHLVAADNDFRFGDMGCIAAYSGSTGSSWKDSIIPIGFTRGTATFGTAREYWQTTGDPSVAFDTKGNAYVTCAAFNRGSAVSPNPDTSSAVYLFRSTGSNGASWNFPGRPVIEANAVTGTSLPFEDKPYMTIDNHSGSPFQDRIYVTYTEFAADGSAYIWQSFSNDYGQTFSPRVLVSGNNTVLCTQTFGAGTPNGNCNENQYSQPFTGPDGALYVVFANFNNTQIAPDNRNQILLAKSTDGGNTFSNPVKVSDYYDLPDCATYQGGKDEFRSCVPEKGTTALSFFRAANYPVGAVNPGNASQVAVTVGSYINRDSNELNGCAPAGLSGTTGLNLYTGVKTSEACNNKIIVSTSSDGGNTFTGAASDPRQLPVVNQASAQTLTDQWFQWVAFTTTGKLAVSYYDRQYGSDETNGFMDISLSDSSDLATFATTRVTTSSMPPPTQFSGLFIGDHSGLSSIDDNAHPIWTDTRNRDYFLCPGTGVPAIPPLTCAFTNATAGNDQQLFTRTLTLP